VQCYLRDSRLLNVAHSPVTEVPYSEQLRSLADVLIGLRGKGVELTPPPGMIYPKFTEIGGSRRSGVEQVLVEVVRQQVSSDELAEPFFLCEPTWRIFRKGSGYALAFRWRAGFPDDMVVHSDAQTSRVRICVSSESLFALGNSRSIQDPFQYPLDQLLLMNHLACRGGMIVHAAGAVVEKAAVIFPGISGAGKSTLARILGEAMPEMLLLSDDRIIVRTMGNEFRAYGTPWPGDAGIAENDSGSLRAFCFLRKGIANQIVSLSPAEGARRLFPVISCPWYDPERLPGVLDTCERLVTEMPCFELQFTPTSEVVPLIEDFVMRELAV
jgi:hypothetical protein